MLLRLIPILRTALAAIGKWVFGDFVRRRASKGEENTI